MQLAILLQITQTSPGLHDSVRQVIGQTAVPTTLPQPTEETMSLLDLLMKGGPIMIPILILSLLAVYVFIERYLAIKKASKEESNLIHNVRDFIHAGRIDSALSFCRSSDKPVSRMIEKVPLMMDDSVKPILLRLH